MQPAFSGSRMSAFKRHMSTVMTELTSVATNFLGNDDRTQLSSYVSTSEGAGYLIAVREDKNTSPEILQAAKALHELIQDSYR